MTRESISSKRDFKLKYLGKYIKSDISKAQIMSECERSKANLYSSFKRYLSEDNSIPMNMIIGNLKKIFSMSLNKKILLDKIRYALLERTKKEVIAQINFGIRGKLFSVVASWIKFWPVSLYFSKSNRIYIPAKLPDAVYVAILSHEFAHSIGYGEIDATILAMDICLEFNHNYPDSNFDILFDLWMYYSAAMVMKVRWEVNHFVLPVSEKPFILGRLNKNSTHSLRNISRHYTIKPYLFLKKQILKENNK